MSTRTTPRLTGFLKEALIGNPASPAAAPDLPATSPPPTRPIAVTADSLATANLARAPARYGPNGVYDAQQKTLQARADELQAMVESLSGEKEKRLAVEAELARLQKIAATATAEDQFIYISPDAIGDALCAPRDRLDISFSDEDYKELVKSIAADGQNEPITVRLTPEGEGGDYPYQIASGRRRLAACKYLGIKPLCRVRRLTDDEMVKITYTENEVRSGISPLERGRWLAEVVALKKKVDPEAIVEDVAAMVGMKRSSAAHLIRLTKIPASIISRLEDPRRLSVSSGRRILEILKNDKTAEARMIKVLDKLRSVRDVEKSEAGRPIDDIKHAIDAGEAKDGEIDTPGRLRARRREGHQIWRGTKRLFSISYTGGRCAYQFAPEVPKEIVDNLAERLADLIQAEIEKASDESSDKSSEQAG